MVFIKQDFLEYKNLSTTTPVGRDTKPGWYTTHQSHQALYNHNDISCILIGDSIIANLKRYSPEIWAKYFHSSNVLNLGIGGDRTQHVLWRAEGLDLKKTLKCVIIHCGTNNIDRDPPSAIAYGILCIAATFKERIDNIDIIVTGLLPRDLASGTKRRMKIIEVNQILEKLCAAKFDNVYYMKQDDNWILGDGVLDESLYYVDHLHLNKKGNEKFTSSIRKAIDGVTGDIFSGASSDGEEMNRSKFGFQNNVMMHLRRCCTIL